MPTNKPKPYKEKKYFLNRAWLLSCEMVLATNGYIDATLAKEAGVKLYKKEEDSLEKFLELEETKVHIESIAITYHLSPENLTYIDEDEDGYKHVWMHEDLAYFYIKFIDDRFFDWCDRHIFRERESKLEQAKSFILRTALGLKKQFGKKVADRYRKLELANLEGEKVERRQPKKYRRKNKVQEVGEIIPVNLETETIDVTSEVIPEVITEETKQWQELCEYFYDFRDLPVNGWDQIEPCYWHLILEVMPELSKYCNGEGIESWQWAKILLKCPHLSYLCDLKKLSADETADLIIKQPQFDWFCNWKMFDAKHWLKILAKRPKLVVKCAWRKFSGDDWVKLMEVCEQVWEWCDWDLLSEENNLRLQITNSCLIKNIARDVACQVRDKSPLKSWDFEDTWVASIPEDYRDMYVPPEVKEKRKYVKKGYRIFS